MRLSYKSKFILLFTLFGVFVVAGSLMAYYAIESRNVKKEFLENASTIISIKQDRFRQFVSRTGDAVTSLSENRVFREFVRSGKNKAVFESIVTMVAASNPDFLTLGFVDAGGAGRFRFERDAQSGSFVPADVADFDDAACAGETMELAEKKVRFGTARTVVGGAEYPAFKVSTPLYEGDEAVGFVYLEADMRGLIDAMQKSSVGYIHLSDAEGKILLYEDDLYLGEDGFNLHRLYGEMADDILFADIYVGRDMYAQTIRVGEENEFKIILQMRSDTLERKKEALFLLSLWLIAAVALLSLPLAYLFAIIPDRLNRKIVEKSEELAELNRNLEERVVEEVKIRREKEKMLVHQSKMAAMGEMIGAIAHQWRQPLNTLSLIAMGIKDYFRRGKLDEKQLEHEMAKVENQLQFMSKTIDDFRNFFKADKAKEPFDVARAIRDVLTLLSSQIVKHNIEIVFECVEAGEVKASVHLDESDAAFRGFYAYVDGYRNEFKQVILNIVNNAKDAILEKERAGKITIRVALEGEEVVTTIRDNGGGIPEAVLSRIFEPYFSTKGEHGTGVGLDMSKTIIEENMNGRIRAENKEGGALFTITLARSAAPLSAPTILFEPVKPAEAKLPELPELPEHSDAREATEPGEDYLESLMEDFSFGASGNSSIDFIEELYAKEPVSISHNPAARLEEISENLYRLQTTFDTLKKAFPNIRTFRENSTVCVSTIREFSKIKQVWENKKDISE